MHDHPHLAERGTRAVAWLTAITMLLEIAAGMWFNSMALTADGWHMSTHTVALGLSAFAYNYARRHAGDPRFAFGTFKVEVLGAYTSGLFLLGVAVMMVWQSFERLVSPLPISFDQAIAVAIVGLLVNLVCALVLHHSHDEHGHHDLNLRAAYLHVLADAATSVLAILALLGGKLAGWDWLDPVTGIVGALLVAAWARGLIRDSGRVLLDAEMDDGPAAVVDRALDGVAVDQLQVWRIERNGLACWVRCAEADAGEVRRRLQALPQIRQLAINP